MILKNLRKIFFSSLSSSSSSLKLFQLRKRMKDDLNINCFLIPQVDCHGSEYISNYFKRIQFISNFTGSAGTIIITQNNALLWTDGRYHNQAELELDLNHWKIMKDAAKGIISIFEYLHDHLESNSIVGFDPLLHSHSIIEKARNILSKKSITLQPFHSNPIDSIWNSQPQLPISSKSIRIHPLQYAGLNPTEKLELIRSKYFHQSKQDNTNQQPIFIVTSLDEIAWLYNIRGNDVKCNPVVYSYAIIQKDNSFLYLNLDDELPNDIKTYFNQHNVHIRPYNTFYSDIEKYSKTSNTHFIFDSSTINEELYNKMTSNSLASLEPLDHSPITNLKSCKNNSELEGMKSCHLRDAAACIHFLWEIFNSSQHIYTEVKIDERITELRKLYSPDHFLYPSFDTIAGVGPNGAIVHYRAQIETCRTLTLNDILLLDSGGQYIDGTTDITRTIHLGEPSQYHREMYTRVLIGHIDLATTIFPNNTPGCLLDSIARRSLWKSKNNYLHGTGHGVGAALCVHEGPQRISSNISSESLNSQYLKENMIVSIEPGYYETNEFGIRLENLYYIKQISSLESQQVFYSFIPLTFVPFQRNLIDITLLSKEHIDWINAYHQEINNIMKDYIHDNNIKEWLNSICQELK